MDANRIQDQSKELVDKLLSADPADVADAVNQYFQRDAALLTSSVHVVGAEKIKKLGKANAWTRSKSGQVTDKPKYDQKSKTIRYSSTLTQTTPRLPSYIPLSAQLSNFESKAEWDFVAHLTSEDGKKMYVKKLEAKRKIPTMIERSIPPFVLRPIATSLALSAVAIITFVQNHKGDGVLGFILAAMTELVNTMWSVIAPEIGKRQEQADEWRKEKVPQIKEYLQNASSNALDTASKVRADIESRAKSAGIPVDDFTSRASSALSDLQENLEARAKTAGIPVEEYKKQAEAAIEELKRRAAGMGEYLEGKAGEAKEVGGQAVEKAQEVGNEASKKAGQAGEKAKEVGKQAQEQAGEAKKQAGKKAGEAKEGAENVAQDAQKKANGAANNAKQSAQSAKSSNNNSNKTSQDAPALGPAVVSTGKEAGHLDPNDAEAKRIQAEFDATPHTPLGGHDPTAPNAPSFAAAAKI